MRSKLRAVSENMIILRRLRYVKGKDKGQYEMIQRFTISGSNELQKQVKNIHFFKTTLYDSTHH